MRQPYTNVLTFATIVFFLSQLFIYSSQLKSDDELHQKQFNMKYGIFAINQPNGLNFANLPFFVTPISISVPFNFKISKPLFKTSIFPEHSKK